MKSKVCMMSEITVLPEFILFDQGEAHFAKERGKGRVWINETSSYKPDCVQCFVEEHVKYYIICMLAHFLNSVSALHDDYYGIEMARIQQGWLVK